MTSTVLGTRAARPVGRLRLLGWGLAMGLCAGAQADTYLVTTLADSGPGSLREAVDRANQNPGPDTIRFALDGTIELASALIVRDDLRLDGLGQRVQLSGGGATTLLVLAEAQKRLEISRLTLSRGTASASTGGAVMARGRLVVSESLFVGNLAPMGGAIYSTGDTLDISNTTFAENQALSWGGAVAVSPNTVANITHSTFVNNSAAQFGAALFQNPIYAATPPARPTSGAIVVRNSIFSGVSAQGQCSVISNRITDGGGNLSSDHSCPFDAAHGSASGLNPMLGSLADHGGPTRTYLPQPGSPAVDAGIDTLAQAPTGNSLGTDQRGLRRNVGLRVDRGAVELQATDRLAARPEPVAESHQQPLVADGGSANARVAASVPTAASAPTPPALRLSPSPEPGVTEAAHAPRQAAKPRKKPRDTKAAAPADTLSADAAHATARR